jgi:hypothetical protein
VEESCKIAGIRRYGKKLDGRQQLCCLSFGSTGSMTLLQEKQVTLTVDR